MPSKPANKRKSMGDIPSNREKKVRKDEDPALTIQEQRQRAKEWHNKMLDAAPKQAAPHEASGRSSIEASAAKSSLDLVSPPILKPSRANSSRTMKSPSSSKSQPPVEFPGEVKSRVQIKSKKESKRRQTLEGVVRPRVPRQQKEPLMSAMPETGSYGFKTIEGRKNSKPIGLAPKAELLSASLLNRSPGAEQGMSLLSSLVFVSLSFGVLLASLCYTKQSHCLFILLSSYIYAMLIPLRAMWWEEYCTSTMLGAGVWLLTYFLLGGDEHGKTLQY